MTDLITASQMRAIEAAAITSGAVSGLSLMERAGQGVVQAIFDTWPEFAQTTFHATILCGPGNNGGDGFVIARLLKQWGWTVDVYLLGSADKLPPDARTNYDLLAALGGVRPLAKDAFALPCDLLVDAVFGTGLTRGFDSFGPAISELNRGTDRPKVVAVDIPSGLCADSGRVLTPGVPVTADLTVTFHQQKLGHFLGDGPAICGEMAIVDIGLTTSAADAATLTAPHSGLAKIARQGHKLSHGHALVLAGPSGKGGAARLAARGALRIGAGLVTIGCPQEAVVENAAQLNAVMLTALGDAHALEAILQDDRINALCFGPGLGVARAADLLPTALASGRPSVFDADALTALSQNSELFERLHADCVLTPHGGEFARLFPYIAQRLAADPIKGPAYSKLDAARDAAARAGCTVLLKGADTVVATPSGHCAINASVYDHSAPWLATAGSGDVLAGFVTGLLARGLSPHDAAETAAWVHTEAARSFGPGLIAEDLPDELPKVLRSLGA